MLNNKSSLVLRVGLAFVFIWFGVQGFMNPSDFTGLVPSFVSNIISAEMLVKMHGAFEIIFGLLLLVGIWTRLVAFLLFLSLLNTVVLLPYGAIMVRDIGLAFAMFSLVLNKKDNSTPLKI